MNWIPLFFCTVLTVCSLAATEEVELEIQLDQSWKSSDNKSGSYRIAYPGRGYDAVTLVAAVQQGKFYRLSFDYRFDNAKQVLIASGNVLHTSFVQSSEWTPARCYFYADRETGAERIRLYFNPEPGSANAEIRHIRLELLSGEELHSDLIPGGQFEAGMLPQGFWRPGWKQTFSGKLTAGTDFLSGNRSLEMMKPEGDSPNILITQPLPMFPGGKATLKCWAKASVAQPFVTVLDFSAKGQKKHHYDLKRHQVTTEWQEYTHSASVPSLEQEPALKCRMMHVQLQRFDQPGNVYVDGVSFQVTADEK